MTGAAQGQNDPAPAGDDVIYRQVPDRVIAFEVIGDGAVLLPAIPATVFVLNATAAQLWGVLGAGVSPDQVLTGLATEDPRRHAVRSFFDDLRKAGLICPAAKTAAPLEPVGLMDRPAPNLIRWHRSSEDDQAAYFDAALALVQEAAQRGPTQERYFEIAGVALKIVYSSPVLADFFAPALAPHAVDPTPCQITLHVCDGVTGGTDLPPPLPAQNMAGDGSFLGMPSGDNPMAFDWESYALSLARQDRGTGIYWVADPSGLTASAVAAPLRDLLAWVLQWHDRHVVRGTVVETGENAVLLIGGAAAMEMTAPPPGDWVVADHPDWPLTALCGPPTARPLGAIGVNRDAGAARHGITLNPTGAAEARLRNDMRAVPQRGHAAQRFAARLSQSLPCHAIDDQTDLSALATPMPRTGAKPHPAISVIMPVYNEVGYLRRALDSIAAQSIADLEVIIVDDGSEQPVTNPGARWPFDLRIIRQNNAGPSAARNTGIRAAQGALIAFLDADDLWPEGRLATMISAFEAAPDLDVVMGFGQTFEQARPEGDIRTLEPPEKAFPYYLGSALFRPMAFAQAGVLDETMRFAEDTDWFNRAHEALLNIHHLGVVTLLVRRHATNVTGHRSMVELGDLRMIKKKHDRLYWKDRAYPDWPSDPWQLGLAKL